MKTSQVGCALFSLVVAIGAGSQAAAAPVPSPGSASVVPAIPFGRAKASYVAHAITPSRLSYRDLSIATARQYNAWKAKFLQRRCGGYVVVSKGEDATMTTSEATGFGMLISAMMAGHDPEAKAAFDGLHAYALLHPSSADGRLMAWNQGEDCQNREGDDSATDGDLDIAYALLLADKQWGGSSATQYRQAALERLAGIRASEIDKTASFPLLGDWAKPNAPKADATRPSDFMTGHFRAFAKATGQSDWTHLVDSSYALLGGVQARWAPNTGLLPDFVVNPAKSPAPAHPNFLEDAADGSYAYNACRVPLRLGVDYLWSGDARARDILQRLNAWFIRTTGGDPMKLRPGYGLDGKPADDDEVSMAFVAPLAVSAMVDGSNQAWLDALWKVVTEAPPSDYYEETLRLLSMMAVSGNFLSP